MELAGGTLSATAAELHAVIPLPPGRELAAVTDT
jgi:hypothetical protein